MTASTGTLTIDSAPRPIAGGHTALAVLKNTGTAAVRIIAEPAGDSLNGLSIAPAATVEIEPRGRTIYAVSNSPTDVEITRYSVAALRADAAAEFRIPVELIRGRTKAEIGESAVRFYAHEQAAE